MKIVSAGENSVIVYFADSASAEVTARVQHAVQQLSAILGNKLIDLTPSYASLLITYDPFSIDQSTLRTIIHNSANSFTEGAQTQGRLIELPCFYSADYSPDLSTLANRAGIPISEVIERHTQVEYRVYAIGFAPGFAYLGDVDPLLATPRLDTPRLSVPRGAVAIADRQTAVYPAESPGGWNLIGLCPSVLFDPQSTPPMPFSVGDRVRFHAISQSDYIEQGGQL